MLAVVLLIVYEETRKREEKTNRQEGRGTKVLTLNERAANESEEAA